MTRRPDIEACALWLQRRLGAFVFAVDHPGLPESAGAHRPGQPCDGSRGKHPCGRWSRDSTNDPGEILAVLARGLLVVDEDRPGAFAEYAASLGEEIPVTFAVRTGKGTHFYLRQPEGEPLGNGRGKLSGQGIDIRGKRGCTVAPGSVHQTGALYRPVDPSVPLASAPGWLVAALRAAPPAPGRPAPQRRGFAYGRLRGVVATVLDAKQAERNCVLYWASCRLAEMMGSWMKATPWTS